MSTTHRVASGQSLSVTGPKGAQTYMVQPGDTVIGISERLAVR